MGYEHKVGIRVCGMPLYSHAPLTHAIELRAHMLDGRPEPEYKIRLCFGEEYPGPPGQPEERLIMAHVSYLPI